MGEGIKSAQTGHTHGPRAKRRDLHGAHWVHIKGTHSTCKVCVCVCVCVCQKPRLVWQTMPQRIQRDVMETS